VRSARHQLVQLGLLGTLVVVVAFIALLCFVPPISRDALIHHLAVPKLYLKAGGMIEIPAMDWSYYPMNLDVLYWLCLWLGSDILPKFVHFAFGLGTAWLIYRYLQNRLAVSWGLAGSLLFLTIPVVMKLSTTVYVDLGLAFFSLAATLSLFQCREARFHSWKCVGWAGVLCGLGMGVKYNGFLVCLLLALLLPVLVIGTGSKREQRVVKAARLGLLFVVAALFAYAPTGVRNTVWTGNPVYPLYNASVQSLRKAWLEPRSMPLKTDPAGSQETSAHLYPLQIRTLIHGESILEVALLPLRIFLQGKDGDLSLFDGRFSPLLLLFLPLVLGWRRLPPHWRSDVGSLLFVSWGYIIIALLWAQVRVRYLVPVAPHLVILAIYGIKRCVDGLGEMQQSILRMIGIACLALFIGYGLWMNMVYAAALYRYVKPWDFLAGRVDRGEYISRYSPEYAAFEYLNQTLDDNALLYFIFMGRRGY